MQKQKYLLLFTLVVLLLGISTSSALAQEETPMIRAILFYSPYCGHCAKVINEDLPLLFEKYPNELFILGINITSEEGQALFVATIDELGYTQEQAGVPFMLINGDVLIGSDEIPAKLPGIIESGLSAGGIDWPTTPTLRAYLETNGFIEAAGSNPVQDDLDQAATEAAGSQTPVSSPTSEPAVPTATLEPTAITPPTATNNPTAVLEPTETPGITLIEENGDVGGFDFSRLAERFARDKTANTISVIVLLAMIVVVLWVGVVFMQAGRPKVWPKWIMPVLLVIGLGVAFYLSFVEVSGTEAICGPVGDCNTVQTSPYAILFGVLPVGILGLVGYLLIGLGWVVAMFGPQSLRFTAKTAIFLFALFGILFSIYLTFLEPFVIGASCVWCLSSAIIMTLVTINATSLALDAWAETGELSDEDDALDDDDDDEIID